MYILLCTKLHMRINMLWTGQWRRRNICKIFAKKMLFCHIFSFTFR